MVPAPNLGIKDLLNSCPLSTTSQNPYGFNIHAS